MNKYLINVILIIVWMFTIFHFSNQTGGTSKDTSDNFIIKIVTTITHKDLSSEEKAKILSSYSFITRKTAHFTAYFILSILVFHLFYMIYGLISKSYIYSFILCLIYACSDEIHQLFINGRSGEISDVIIDVCGSIIFLLIFFIFHRKKLKKQI